MKTGKRKFIKYTIDNNTYEHVLEVRQWSDVELRDERGSWWEVETPVLEAVAYPVKSDQYYDIKKELEKKYKI